MFRARCCERVDMAQCLAGSGLGWVSTAEEGGRGGLRETGARMVPNVERIDYLDTQSSTVGECAEWPIG